jgi:hypothetical protein
VILITCAFSGSCGTYASRDKGLKFVSMLLRDGRKILASRLGTSVKNKDIIIIIITGCARGSVVVKALCYKQEGRGFDTR